jgi:ribose transport system permease protein
MSPTSSAEADSRAAPTLPPGEERAHRRAERALGLAIRVVSVGPLLILAVGTLVMSILSPVFLTEENLQNLGIQAALVGCVAVGQLLVILTQGIDLSVGSVVGLAGVVGIELAVHGVATPLVIAGMVATGVAVGLVNGGLMATSRNANAIVVTLATLGIARGLALIISGGQTQPGFPDIFDTLGTGRTGPIPNAVIVLLAVVLLAAVLTQLTQWGRWIYAVGADAEAASRAGISRRAVIVSVYLLSGMCAGIAAILIVGQSSVAQPTSGTLLELDAITAAIIGGASLLGGRGTVGNVVVGVLILAVIRNGLNLLSVDPYIQQVAIGVLVLVAIQLDSLRAHLESRFRTNQALTS